MHKYQITKIAFIGFAILFCANILFSQQNKPNILFIFADDHTYEALSAFGSEAKTPNLDKLAERGTVFNNAYNMGSYSGAVCIASRTMLNTGRFVWNALDLEPNMAAERNAGRIWPQYLDKNGYDTYFAGKWHVRNSSPSQLFANVGTVRPGMPQDHFDWGNRDVHHIGYDRPAQFQPDEWSPYDSTMGGYWNGGKHWSEVLADESEGFLQQAAGKDDPFFMYLAFNAPHDPRQSPKEYVDMYPLDAIAVPENFQSLYPHRDEIGCGYALRDARLAPFPRMEYAVKVHRQEYYALITHMDVQIGRILDALEATGKADSTWIFFSADHGLSVGERGLLGKQNMYEEAMKAPLIINGPGVEAGKTIDVPVYIQDIMATTLELSGEGIPDHVQFKSLLPLLNG
ncbi:MAG: choline-sulfatase, partial [Calditrichaeota bacterium]